jgi:hypothetical protein
LTDLYGSYSEGQLFNAFYTHLDVVKRANIMGVRFDPEVMTGLMNMSCINSSYMDWNGQGRLVEDVRCSDSVPEVADLVWLYSLAYRLDPIIHDICSKS